MANQLSLRELSLRINNLPESIQNFIDDTKNTRIDGQIIENYKLNNNQIDGMLATILAVFLKDVALQEFPNILKENVEIKDEIVVKNLAIEIAQKKFFPLREHLIGIEKLIKDLGGEIPKDVPKFKSTLDPEKLKAKRYSIFPEKQKTAQKDIRSALKENENLKDQLVGKKAIKIASSEVSVKPSIKNWLADYEKTLGAGFHSNIERVNYLYQSKNAKKLLPHERENLGLILKSFDENSALPISTKNGLMIFPFKPPAETLPKKSIPVGTGRDPSLQRQRQDKIKNAKKKREKKYQDIKSAPEKTTRTMAEDMRKIFRD